MMYEKFRTINGIHPWRHVSPQGYVDYSVRYREGGQVIYFNFSLAKELGLIAKNHPHRMNPRLEKAILNTFALQIINEYDRAHNIKFSEHTLRKELYMATRYLQSQHKNKRGKTSGDGRSIWNGFIHTKQMTFDVSSCGTGATILSPGAQQAGRFIKTGDERLGYASGLAEIDEMLGNAIMSEIFYREGIPTERCLTMITFQGNSAIGVRTAPNLIRPAHIFRYLKMGLWKEMKGAFDYFLRRQEENRVWTLPAKGKRRYYKALEYFAKTYARLVAVLEEEYIFNWLAWDGDNMLASGALLDYGSIRQFAAKHNKYRYEDVDRFSSCLTEQRYWAKKLVQTFAQSVDFIVSHKKKNLEKFEKDKSLRLFDHLFIRELQKRMLWRIGFTTEQINYLIEHHQDKIQDFRRALNYFEAMKTIKGPQRVPDGIDHPPVFLVRYVLRELPLFILKNWNLDYNYIEKGWPLMAADKFCELMAASYVNRKDLKLTLHHEQKAISFQQIYHDLIFAVRQGFAQTQRKILESVAKRSVVINYVYRTTGDGLIWIVDEALRAKKKMNQQQFQETIDRFIKSQVLVPGQWKPIPPKQLQKPSRGARLLRRFEKTLALYNEMI